MKPELDSAERGIRRQAARWLALMEARPLTLKEQADFAEWREARPAHATIFRELQANWRAFDCLARHPHCADRSPDPDLFKPAASARPARWIPVGLAAAAAIAVASLFWFAPERDHAPAAALPAPSIIRLPDGSVVELNRGAEVRAAFTPGERRVALVRGEAHFAVAKNKERPFVVEANGVAVRAVGTAFNVSLRAQGVEVIVTEGTVRVTPPAAGGVARTASPGIDPSVPPSPISHLPSSISALRSPVSEFTLTAGQRTLVPTHPEPSAPAPQVDLLSPAAIDRALAWQTTRITFDDMPLAELVARINAQASARADPARIELADAPLRELRVSGRVRTDDLESFIEVLESSFGVRAERTDANRVVLHRAGRP